MKLLLKNKLFIYLFLVPFILTAFYISFFQAELFRSFSSILIKDLSTKQEVSMELGLFSGSSNGNLQDAAVIEEYLRSHEVYKKLDEKYNLSTYYQSSEFDLLNKIWTNSDSFTLIKKYNQNIEIVFDERSGILNIGFYHTDPQSSLKISKELLKISEKKLNLLNKISSKKVLTNIISTVNINKKSLELSTKKLEEYQNKYNLIDPQIQIEQKNSLIASLKTTLIKKEVEYSALKNYTAKNNLELKQLANEIKILKSTILDEKKELSGDHKTSINKKYFEFEKLKSQVEFDKEIYKQSLAQYEIMKTQTTQKSKTLQVIVAPTLPDAYALPDKPKNIITAFILYMVIFGIIYLLRLVIRDHQD